ncbi:MAG: hypothetical protein QOI21_6130, partial [Actinomycetota bacterium]|nr:hypothetical protein [Actinomycetota bacterium]
MASSSSARGRTMAEKVWESHTVHRGEGD